MMMKLSNRTGLNVDVLKTGFLKVDTLKVGDRVRLVRGSMRGHTATISAIKNGGYFLIGDWTKQTGFVLVNYGPVEADNLKKL